MFVDEVVITISSGSGGDGLVSFRREKFVAKGGPDGGDGGSGGSVYFRATNNLNTLHTFRNKKEWKAKNGEPGQSKKMTGKSAPDLIIDVPVGTIIRDAESNKLIADLSKEEEIKILEGGPGGKGNTRFKTSTRQVPQIALKGIKGKSLTLKLELKLLADVALVGLPNAGKSSFISSVTASKAKIGSYAFTTLTPNLGVASHRGQNFVIADVPGLIEGASEGKGLGIQFLKHIERTKILLHLIDLGSHNLKNDFDVIEKELAKYSDILVGKKRIVVGNKIDLLTKDREDDLKEFKEYIESKDLEYFEISVATREGLDKVLDRSIKALDSIEPVELEEEIIPISYLLQKNREEDIIITKKDGVYEVKGRILSSLLEKYVINRVTLSMAIRVLRREGLDRKLLEAGARDGDTVSVVGEEFRFME